MPARPKGKTPGRPTRKSSRQNDSAGALPGTPGWQAATSSMFDSPSFTPPQSPPRSRQVKGGRVTKTKVEPKSRRQTLSNAAAKVMSPRLTRGRRATMLPSELVTIKSPPASKRRTSVYQRPGATKAAASEDFKMPDPVAIMRASRKKSPAKKAASPPKRATVKQVVKKPTSPKPPPAKKPVSPKAPAAKKPVSPKAPAAKKPVSPKAPAAPKKQPSPKQPTAKKQSPPKQPAAKQPTTPKPAPPAKKSPARKISPVKKVSPAKSTPKLAVKERTPKIVTRTRTPAKTVTVTEIVTPSSVFSESITTVTTMSTGRASRSAKATPKSPKLMDTPRPKIVKKTPASVKKTPALAKIVKKTPPSVKKTPASAKRTPASAKRTPASAKRTPASARKTPVSARKTPASAKLSLKRTSIHTPKSTRNTSANNSSIYASPKGDASSVIISKDKVIKEKTTLATPVHKQLERLRIMGSESSKKVRIQSEKSDSLTKVYRKTPSRGGAASVVATTTVEVAESSTGTPIKAARILGKTPALASAKKPVKPKNLAESLISPKTSTPRELRKRRADFPEPVSEIRLSKKAALDIQETTENVENEESLPVDITADLSIARPEDVRSSSWWGWCTIM